MGRTGEGTGEGMNKLIYTVLLSDIFMMSIFSTFHHPFTSGEEKGSKSLKSLLKLLGTGSPKETWMMPQQCLESTQAHMSVFNDFKS